MPTFRDQLLARVPWWLRNGNAGKVLWTIGVHIDALVDAAAVAVKHRFPGNTTLVDALPIVGRDRKIRRGVYETTATYQSRLVRWLDYHHYRGSPGELLRKVQEHFAPLHKELTLRSYLGRQYVLKVDGTLVGPTQYAGVWPPDGDAARWARLWLYVDYGTVYMTDEFGDLILDEFGDPIIEVAGVDFGDDGFWGDPGQWGDGGVWGSGLDPIEIGRYTAITHDWLAAHIEPLTIVFVNDGTPVEWQVSA